MPEGELLKEGLKLAIVGSILAPPAHLVMFNTS